MIDGKPALNNAAKPLETAIWILLLMYCSPIILITYSFFASDQFSEADAYLKFFVGLTFSSDESLSIVHRVLLPMMGGFAPIAFRNEANTYSAKGLIVVLLVGIGASIFISAMFSSLPVQENLRPHNLFYVPSGQLTDNIATNIAFNNGMTLIKTFLNRTQESMGMYLMLLFGLQLEKATK